MKYINRSSVKLIIDMLLNSLQCNTGKGKGRNNLQTATMDSSLEYNYEDQTVGQRFILKGVLTYRRKDCIAVHEVGTIND